MISGYNMFAANGTPAKPGSGYKTPADVKIKKLPPNKAVVETFVDSPHILTVPIR